MWGFLTLNRGGSEFDNELTTATVYGFGHISNLQAIPNMTWHTRLICLYIIATCIYNTLFPNPIMRVLSDQWYILIRVTQCCLNFLFQFKLFKFNLNLYVFIFYWFYHRNKICRVFALRNEVYEMVYIYMAILFQVYYLSSSVFGEIVRV
jgi:hypothetical protein